jgi:DNA-binding transcriptional LysR family regulator
VDRAVAQAQHFASGHLGTLRVAISEIIATDEFISRCVLHFREREPGVVLELRSAGAMLQISAFKNNQLDAAIVYDANIDEHEAPLLNRAKIGRGEVMLAVHRDHPLADRDSVSMAELAEVPVLWPERRLQPGYHDRLMRAWLQAGAMPHVVQECTTTAILMSLVSVGMGAGVVAVTQAIVAAAREIRFVPIRDLGLTFDLLVVWRKRDPSAALHRFLEAMKDEVNGAG